MAFRTQKTTAQMFTILTRRTQMPNSPTRMVVICRGCLPKSFSATKTVTVSPIMLITKRLPNIIDEDGTGFDLIAQCEELRSADTDGGNGGR